MYSFEKQKIVSVGDPDRLGMRVKGVDLKTVQELLGHKSFEMTLRYAHLSPEHKKAALDVLCKRLVRNPNGQHGETREKYPGRF